jgi:cobalamin biosynthesis Mg chelatase CobN
MVERSDERHGRGEHPAGNRSARQKQTQDKAVTTWILVCFVSAVALTACACALWIESVK